jgi:hypothetical protein
MFPAARLRYLEVFSLETLINPAESGRLLPCLCYDVVAQYRF